MFGPTKALVSTILISFITFPAFGQDQNTHQRTGFGISFGVGAGSASADCFICDSDSETSVSSYVRIGGYIGPRVFLSGESNAWIDSENDVDQLLGFYTATALWYPSESSGFFLKGGVGFSIYFAEDFSDEITGTASGITIGLGHDFRVGRNFSLTPYLNYLESSNFDLELNGIPIALDASADMVQIGLGFTWH